MNTLQYIEEVKRINGLDTDYKAAKLLGWRQTKISNYRNGQTMDNRTARQIAQTVNVSVWKVIADMETERAKDEDEKKAWKMLAKRTKEAGTASINLLFFLPFLAFLGRTFYILCKIDDLRTTAPSRVNAN